MRHQLVLVTILRSFYMKKQPAVRIINELNIKSPLAKLHVFTKNFDGNNCKKNTNNFNQLQYFHNPPC